MTGPKTEPASVPRRRRRRGLQKGQAAVAAALLGALPVAGCTSGGNDRAAARSSPPPATCPAPSPILESSGPEEVVGSSAEGLSLYGQFQDMDTLTASGKTRKIVWRISGTGDPVMTVQGPAAATDAALEWGPEFHTGSNYDRPGDEYGTGVVFDAPGCWTVTFTRADGSAGVQLQVNAAAVNS